MLYRIIIILIVLAIIAIFIVANNKYYQKIFARGHYNEIANWAIEVLGKGQVEQPSVDNGTVLMTRAGIVIAYTRSFDDGDSIHFSISQINRSTTHAVGGRIIFLLLTLLNQNHCNANFFYSQSSVHHLVLQRSEIDEWHVNSIEQVLSKMNSYQPLPLELKNI
jgi:uncharacterized integral membrane protein